MIAALACEVIYYTGRRRRARHRHTHVVKASDLFNNHECAVPINVITANWPLLLGMGVLMLGAGLQSTLLGLRATLEGFSALVTGIIMSCYYVGYVVGTIIAPPLLRQVGHIRVFAVLAAVASVAIMIQGLC